MTTQTTEQATFQPGDRPATITRDATIYCGVALDRAVITGPRGGRSVAWRAAWCRQHLIASYCDTRDEAARVAPGYTG